MAMRGRKSAEMATILADAPWVGFGPSVWGSVTGTVAVPSVVSASVVPTVSAQYTETENGNECYTNRKHTKCRGGLWEACA